jgi:(p)ppGpp synthase/HD superfamily hydrolase
MKLSGSLSQNLSLQLSTALALETGMEQVHMAVKSNENNLTAPEFIREIKSTILRASAKSFFSRNIPAGHLVSGIPHLLEKALRYAAYRHKGEYRDSGYPYLAHTLSAGFLLSRLGFPGEVVLAGILHDAVEDTPDKNTVLNDLYAIMPEVAFYVYSVSGPDIKDAVEKDRILKGHIQAYSNLAGNLYPQAIKCADGIANLYDLDFMEGKDGRTAHERKRLFIKKAEEILVPYSRLIDEAAIIPIRKRKERFLLEDFVMDFTGERKQEIEH